MTRPPAADLSPAEAAREAEFDANPAPESFDAVAACRRVLDFAKRYEAGEIGDPGRAVVAWMITVALADSVSGLPAEVTP